MPNTLQNFWSWIGTKFQNVSPITTSAGAADGGKIIATEIATGKIADSLMPNGIGTSSGVFTAGTTLAEWDIVNTWNNSNVQTARKADAGTNLYPATGFCPANITSAETGTVQYEGLITVTGPLDMTKLIYLDPATPGGWTQTPPIPVTDAGKMLQVIGRPVNTTQWYFDPKMPMYL